MLDEIREANLTYLILAQRLLREDRAEAMFRLGVSDAYTPWAGLPVSPVQRQSKPDSRQQEGRRGVHRAKRASKGMLFPACRVPQPMGPCLRRLRCRLREVCDGQRRQLPTIGSTAKSVSMPTAAAMLSADCTGHTIQCVSTPGMILDCQNGCTTVDPSRNRGG